MGNENVVIKFLNKMTDLFVLNLLFLICSLPVITIGASLTAMYATSLRSVRYGDGYVFKTFFTAFKKSFKQATLAWLITLAAGAVLYVDYRFWSQVRMGGIEQIMLVVSIAIIFLVFMVLVWLYPLIAKMDDTLGRQIKNAAAMAVGHFVPYTAVCMALGGGSLYLAYTTPAVFFIMLLIGFSTVSYMQSFFLYKVFAKYIDEVPASEDDPLYGGDNKVEKE